VLKLEDPDRPDTYQWGGHIRLSDDGKTLIVFSSYHLKKDPGVPRPEETLITAWDTATRKQLFRRSRPGPSSRNVLSPDARVLAVAHEGSELMHGGTHGHGPMHLEDLATGERLLTFPNPDRQIWPEAFSSDARYLASHSWVLKPRSEWKH